VACRGGWAAESYNGCLGSAVLGEVGEHHQQNTVEYTKGKELSNALNLALQWRLGRVPTGVCCQGGFQEVEALRTQLLCSRRKPGVAAGLQSLAAAAAICRHSQDPAAAAAVSHTAQVCCRASCSASHTAAAVAHSWLSAATSCIQGVPAVSRLLAWCNLRQWDGCSQELTRARRANEYTAQHAGFQ
jgi:hypothetical protein